MKKVLSVLLVCSFLLSLCACQSVATESYETGGEPATNAPTSDTPTSQEITYDYPTVPEPMTLERLQEIPIATADMSEEELRQICADFMILNLTFQWTPAVPIHYVIEAYMKPIAFLQGGIYAGIPYNSPDGGSGNLYTLLDFYDTATGILDPDPLTPKNLPTILSNHCSSSCFWAWARVINSIGPVSTNSNDGFANMNMVKRNGYIPVAPFDYEDVENWHVHEGGTAYACQINGRDTMYEAYANVKLADGLIQFAPKEGSTARHNHVQMVAAQSIVERDPVTGKIDGEKSFLIIHEQTSSPVQYTTEAGDSVVINGRVFQSFSFATMFDAHYVPFTFREFLGQDPVEKGTISITASENANFEDMKNSVVESNYAISDIRIYLYDPAGKEIDVKIYRPPYTNTRQCARFFPASWKYYAGKGNTLRISARISTGETLDVYQGILK